MNVRKKNKATGKSMDVGQVPGEEGTHALLSLEAKVHSRYSEDGCPRTWGSVGARFLGLQGAQKLQSKTPKEPAVNVRNVSDPRSHPGVWLCERSFRVQEEARIIVGVTFPATLVRRESHI